jgi:hypothetical protein
LDNTPSTRLRIKTGTGEYASGYLKVGVVTATNGGTVWEIEEKFHGYETKVMEKDYATLASVKLKSTQGNAWLGTVEYSTDAG